MSFFRKKTGVRVLVHFGSDVAEILSRTGRNRHALPHAWPLEQATAPPSSFALPARSTISGVSLHSYRYAWAERAKTAGYPERFAQEALGHNSKAVHRAYAKRALVKIPSLEEYEKQKSSRSLPRWQRSGSLKTSRLRGKGFLEPLAFLLSVGLAHQPVHDPNRLVQPGRVTAQPLQFHHRIPLARVLRRLAQRLQMPGPRQQRHEVGRPAKEPRRRFRVHTRRPGLAV